MTVPARVASSHPGPDTAVGRSIRQVVFLASPATALAGKACDAQQLTGDQEHHGRISCGRGSDGPPNHHGPLILADGRRVRRRPCGAGGVGPAVHRSGASLERPAQWRTGGRDRRVAARPGARHRLRGGRRRGLARPRWLGRHRARGFGGGAAAGCGPRPGRRGGYPLDTRRSGGGRAPAGVVRTRLCAVSRPITHPGRRGRASDAGGGGARTGCCCWCTTQGWTPSPRKRVGSTRRTMSGLRWSPRYSPMTGISKPMGSARVSHPTAAPVRTTPTTSCCAREGCAEFDCTRPAQPTSSG